LAKVILRCTASETLKKSKTHLIFMDSFIIRTPKGNCTKRTQPSGLSRLAEM
jgi:hypothetical protein